MSMEKDDREKNGIRLDCSQALKNVMDNVVSDLNTRPNEQFDILE